MLLNIFAEIYQEIFFRMKVQAVDDMKELYHFKHERLVRRDLMRLTWTSKHKWFPKTINEFKNASRNVPREKPYI